MKEKQLSELIRIAYHGVTCPRGFGPLMDELLRTSGFEVVGISAMGRDDDTFTTQISAGTEDPFVREYIEEIAPVDPYTEHAIEIEPGRHTLPGEALVPRRELLRTEMFDWMQRMGASDLLISAEKTEERGILSLVGFTSRGTRVGDDQIELWDQLAPHMFQAAALSRQFARLEIQNRAALDALSHADFGSICFDEAGRVEWMNPYARQLIEKRDAVELGGDGLLRAVDPRSRRALDNALACALGAASGEVIPLRPIFELPRGNGKRPLEILFSPLRPRRDGVAFEMSGGALMIIADPEHVDEQFAERLQQLYQLTPMEAEIAQWLLSGESVNSIAQIFGNSVHTVRTHVKSLLRKCRVSSQAELVGTLQRSLARLA